MTPFNEELTDILLELLSALQNCQGDLIELCAQKPEGVDPREWWVAIGFITSMRIWKEALLVDMANTLGDKEVLAEARREGQSLGLFE